MKHEDEEVLRKGLDICLKKQKLKFKIQRKFDEQEYEKEIFFMYENDPFDLMDIITRKERLTQSGSCKLLIDECEFDFKNEDVQKVWRDLYNSNEVEYFVRGHY